MNCLLLRMVWSTICAVTYSHPQRGKSNRLVHYQPMLPSILMSCHFFLSVQIFITVVQIFTTVTLIVTTVLFITIAVHVSSIQPPVHLHLLITIKIILTVIIFTRTIFTSLYCSFSTTSSTVNTFLVAIFRSLAVACVKAELTSTTVRVQLQPLSCMCMNFINLLNFRYFCPGSKGKPLRYALVRKGSSY